MFTRILTSKIQFIYQETLKSVKFNVCLNSDLKKMLQFSADFNWQFSVGTLLRCLVASEILSIAVA